MFINQSVNYIDPLSELFGALADPTRRSILERLSLGDHSVNELAIEYDMSLPAVSKHLKVLEKVGLISKYKNAQRRECHLEAARLKEATEWLAEYRQFWERNFDNLETYLDEVQRNK
ncbi:MAG TPA: metalloregulator ArsR/SmtB family transcription factor [Candidatus Saccharimonadales bacterium]